MRYFKDKLLLLLIIIYVIVTVNLSTFNLSFYTNIINPLFWSFLLIFLIFHMKKNYIRFHINSKYILYIIVMSFIHCAIYFYIGFIFGFSKSPYNHKMLSILKNGLIQVLPLVTIEITRYIIVARNRRNKLIQVIITCLLILVQTNYSIIFNTLSNKEEFFKYICSTLIPLISSEILYTYLSLKTSFLLPTLYRVINQIFIITSPVLPDIDWFIIGTEKILFLNIIYILFKNEFINKKNDVRKKYESLPEKAISTVIIILSILIVCFMTGIFKYEPIVILSNSMSPSISKGDVIIFKKISSNDLKEIPKGSIIVYTTEKQNIVHRINKVIKESGEIFYQTKGDNNNFADVNLVKIDQIRGIQVFHFKYIGFPSIWLHEIFNNADIKNETK